MAAALLSLLSLSRQLLCVRYGFVMSSIIVHISKKLKKKTVIITANKLNIRLCTQQRDSSNALPRPRPVLLATVHFQFGKRFAYKWTILLPNVVVSSKYAVRIFAIKTN